MIPGSASTLLMAGEGENPYQIKRSLRFRGAQHLARTFGVPTSYKKTSFSFWTKGIHKSSGDYTTIFHMGDYNLGTALARYGCAIYFVAGQLWITEYYAGTTRLHRQSNAVFRDPSAHYHFVVAIDSTLPQGDEQCVVWCNNVQLTWATKTNPAQNTDLQFQSAMVGYLGVSSFTNTVSKSRYLDGHLSEVNFVDGQALTPASFGMTDPVTGQWSPIAYAGTYGTNGFYLDFSDPSSTANLCLDRSGNANNWTPTGISITAGATYDSMLDVPTRYADGGNGRGNYATLNPLSTTASTLTNGNLTASGTTDLPTILPASGNWYFEISGVTKNWTPPAAFPSAAGDYNFGQRPFTNAITPGYQLLHTGQFTNESVTTSGSFTGNALANGPFVWMNGAPETLTINGNAVTFATHTDKLANGFKLRTTSASYNTAGTNTWTATVLSPASKSAFRKQLAKANP